MENEPEELLAGLGTQLIQVALQGNFDKAVEILKKISELNAQYGGQKSPYYPIELDYCAFASEAGGNYYSAFQLYQKALEIRRSMLGENHPEYIRNLYNVNRLSDGLQRRYHGDAKQVVELKQHGNFQEAIPIAIGALDQAFHLWGKDRPEYGWSLNILAELYREIGKFKEAKQLFEEALDVYRKVPGEKQEHLLQVLNNLAGLYMDIGNYSEAKKLYEQVLRSIRKEFSEDNPNYAICLNNLAQVLEYLGHYSEAEALYLRVIEIESKAQLSNYPISLGNLGRLYHMTGMYSKAERFLRQSLDIQKAGGDESVDYARALNNLASLYLSLTNYKDAELLYSQALEILRKVIGEENPLFAATLDNLGRLYQQMGNYSMAWQFQKKGLDIYAKTLGNNHKDYATSLNNMAILYLQMGDYLTAEQYSRQVFELRLHVLGEKHPDYAQSLNNLASIYKYRGIYSEIDVLYHNALNIIRNVYGEEHPEYVSSLYNLGELYAAMNLEVRALPLMIKGAAIERRIIGQVLSTGSERQRMNYLAILQGHFHRLLSLVVTYFSTNDEAIKAALDQILNRKGLGIEALAMQRDLILGERHPELKDRLSQLTNIRRQIAEKTLAGPGREEIDAYVEQLKSWTALKESLEYELAQQVPEMSLEQKLRASGYREIVNALPIGTALIEFFRFYQFDFKAIPARGEAQWRPARYLAFILHAGQPENIGMIDLGDAVLIEQLIADFRASVRGGNRNLVLAEMQPATPNSGGRDLCQLIFDPLIPALKGCTHLFLAPDGDLSRVPFAALPQANGHYLIDNYSISYLGVGRDILRFQNPLLGQPSCPLVIAAPDFDLGLNNVSPHDAIVCGGRQSPVLIRGGIQFNPLPETKVEGEFVARCLGIEAWLGSEALEGRLKAISSPRILHLATHGFFLEDQQVNPCPNQVGTINDVPDSAPVKIPYNPFGRLANSGENPLLRSGLALAGANTWLQEKPLPVEAEDAILTAEDVSGLDLMETELVVLSACETGLGDIQVGEGVFGLRRAFVLAGTRTLVMSLWKVPDRQTKELMSDFYMRILNGQPRADALRQAQLTIKENYPDPLYWGAFICEGDPMQMR